jgi:hypothetical protein
MLANDGVKFEAVTVMIVNITSSGIVTNVSEELSASIFRIQFVFKRVPKFRGKVMAASSG